MSKKSKDPVVAILSGCISGGIETLVVWPLESTKTRLQLDKTNRYKGMIDCAKVSISEGGVLSLYRGLLPVLIGSMPKAGIRFGGVNFIQGQLANVDSIPTPMKNLTAGVLAGAAESLLVATPVETLKTKLIDGNTSFIRGAVEIVKKDGLGGIYQGALATTGKQASNQGLRFMAFGQYKTMVANYRNDANHQLLWYEALLGGMMSGCFSTLCNNPFDMVKTRMQGLRAAEYNGFVDCVSKVVRNEGVLALWSGTLPRLMRVVPGQG